MKLILLSDIHSNLPALEACLKDFQGEARDKVCVLGDIIAYGPRPKECVEIVRGLERAGALCLKGNHDDNSVRQGTPGGVTSDIGRYELWDRAGMGEDNLAWVGNLPAAAELGDMYFVHASPRKPLTEYVDDEDKCRAALDYAGSRWVFCGHSHRPLCFSLSPGGEATLDWPKSEDRRIVCQLSPGSRHVINVGSVGESRDGDLRACYVVLDTESGRLEYRRVEYDVMIMVEDMKKQGFPEALWGKRVPNGR